jgi:hypothetical protein
MATACASRRLAEEEVAVGASFIFNLSRSGIGAKMEGASEIPE